LLAVIAGRERVAGQPAAAFEVAQLCGHLPLALRIAGNRLASRPTWSIGHLVRQLGDSRRRLRVLTSGDLAVRSVFEVSYRQLSEPAQVTFRRLGLVPGPDFDGVLTGVLTGQDPGRGGGRAECGGHAAGRSGFERARGVRAELSRCDLSAMCAGSAVDRRIASCLSHRRRSVPCGGSSIPGTVCAMPIHRRG
jgi:hypothetical protein